ncbi:MAG TPA: AI-2E family transporter [Candidatus Acidoferrales bacterium]|nr:AI-2E family transporter [Candidatus Acidoferrales bacterium]
MKFPDPDPASGVATRSYLSRDLFHLLAVVVGVAAIAALYFARIVLIPFALALLFTFILTPVVKILERIHLRRIPSTLLVVLLTVGACGAVGWTVAKQLSEVVNELPAYKSNIKARLGSLHWPANQSLDSASETITEISKDLAASPIASHPPSSGSAAVPSPVARSASPARPVPVEVVKAPALPLESVQSVLGLLGSAVIVLVFTIFMLIRREDLRNRLISLAGEGHLHLVTQTLDDASARVSKYLLLQCVVNTCYGIFIGVCLHFIGVPGALLWGVLAGVLRFLPYIGPPLGGIMPLLLSLAVFHGWTQPLIVLLLFIVTELVVSNFIEPMLYGIHTGISSLAILVAAIFWTAIWGPIGLVLSTPLTVCLLVAGRHVPRLRFLHILLGDEPVLTPSSRFYQRLLAMDHDDARRVLENQLEGMTLEDLYDSVLIPALSLAEHDRHQDRLDDTTEKFICQSTRELIEELWEPRDDNGDSVAEAGEATEASARHQAHLARTQVAHPLHILCVPARDEADELVGTMLAQVLERVGHRAQCISVDNASEMLAQIRDAHPDVVCISALPSFAVPHVRSLYAKLRAQQPDLRILVGLWHFSGDRSKISRRLALSDGSQTFTTLAEFIEQLKPAPTADPVPANA